MLRNLALSKNQADLLLAIHHQSEDASMYGTYYIASIKALERKGFVNTDGEATKAGKLMALLLKEMRFDYEIGDDL